MASATRHDHHEHHQQQQKQQEPFLSSTKEYMMNLN